MADRVGEKVYQDLPNPLRVGLAQHFILDSVQHHPDPARASRWLNRTDRLVYEFARVRGADDQRQPVSLETAQVEQVVQQRQGPLRRFEYFNRRSWSVSLANQELGP